MKFIRSMKTLFIAAMGFLQMSPLNSAESCCKLIRTNFGEIFVAGSDISLATKFGNHVRQQAHDILDLADVRFTIVDANHSTYKWADTTPDGLAVYPWRFVHGTNYVGVQPPNAILPHEIGHDLLHRYLIPSTRSGQYGTDAPDWIDEAVAIGFELPEDKAFRRCEALALLKAGKLIGIQRFVTMDHPDLMSVNPGNAPSRDFVFASTVARDTPSFYAMGIAFPEYLAEKTQTTSVLPHLINAYLNGARIDDWIISQLARTANAQNMQDVQRDFVNWLSSDERPYCTRQTISKI